MSEHCDRVDLMESERGQSGPARQGQEQEG
jgi:hypothetical protein